MGSSREIILWLDDRWYDALSRQLEDETVEGKLNDYLDNLISLLPTHIYDKIRGEICAEQQQREQEMEAGKKYSAFRITENGSTEHFMIERSVGMLEAAGYVRTCLRQELGPRPFQEMLHGRVKISAEDFDGMAVARIADGGRITDVLDINFDRQELSAVRSVSGWMTYRMKDVSTAVWHADRGGSYDWNVRQTRLTERLAGKEITSAGHLSAENISLAEDICEMDGQRLNFYLDTGFNVDAVFGTHVCTAENDDTLNVYADYDMRTGQVCDMLEVDLHWADGREESLEYRLDAVEKAVLLRKMDDYCQRQTGQTLAQYSAQLMAEDAQEADGPREQAEQNHGPEMAI